MLESDDIMIANYHISQQRGGQRLEYEREKVSASWYLVREGKRPPPPAHLGGEKTRVKTDGISESIHQERDRLQG